MAKRTATERDEEYKRQVALYLKTVQLVKQWSQSEIARRVGVHPSTANKAFASKHALEYSRLLVLEEQSGIALPHNLTMAYKSLSGPRPISETEVTDFLQGSPEFRRIVILGRQMADAASPEEKAALRQEMAELVAKVS